MPVMAGGTQANTPGGSDSGQTLSPGESKKPGKERTRERDGVI